MQWDEDDEYGRSKILRSDRGVLDTSDPVLFSTTDDVGISLFEDSDTNSEGSIFADFEMDYLSSEVGLPGSRDIDQESLIEQSKNLPFIAQQKRRTNKKALRTVQLDDFENGAQRWAASTLISAIRYFFETVETGKGAQDVSNWIFAKNTDPASFDNCCIVNEARPDVLRMRIQYELWRKGLRAASILPISENDLPDYISEKSFFVSGSAGLTVAQILWKNPGIGNTELVEILDNKQRSALSTLADHYIASPIETSPYRWYATGINPILQEMDQSDNSGSVSYRYERRRKLDMSWASRFEEL